MQQTKTVLAATGKKLNGKEMKQLLGGGGGVPRATWWYCPTDPIICASPQAECNAECTGSTCRLTTVCL
jgi:hypothetical protein